MIRLLKGCWHALLLLTLTLGVSAARAQNGSDDAAARTGAVPDLRQGDVPATAKKGNFVAVPIPFSNPTIDSGIVGAVGYFHAQTEQQAATQPASVTGFGAMYSSNKSYGVAVGHQGYWKEDRWRFSGIAGYADVNLVPISLGQNGELLEVDWRIKGSLLYAELSRRVAKDWYVGLAGRWTDIEQDFAINILSLEFELRDKLKTSALGVTLTYDTRDMPTNAYEGRYFKINALSNGASLGSDLAYQAYSLQFRSYHSIKDSLVLAWELAGCERSDGAPLWDACRIGLRGFSATDYLGKSSLYGQLEARWRFNERWGMAAFAGAGRITRTLSGLREGDVVPSYGLGVRFMVSTAQRINMRLDYGRSTDSDAVYLSVLEAF